MTKLFRLNHVFVIVMDLAHSLVLFSAGHERILLFDCFRSWVKVQTYPSDIGGLTHPCLSCILITFLSKNNF